MTDRFMSLLAVGISLIALMFSGWQTLLTYQHNRVSVIPRLTLQASASYVDKDLLQLTLVNVGLGPALVTDASITVRDVDHGKLGWPGCQAVIDHFELELPMHNPILCYALDEDVFLKAGESLTIFSIGQRTDGERAIISAEKAKDIHAAGNYCSLYDECFELK